MINPWEQPSSLEEDNISKRANELNDAEEVLRKSLEDNNSIPDGLKGKDPFGIRKIAETQQGVVTKKHLERIIATIQKLEKEKGSNAASNSFKKEAKEDLPIRKNDNKPAS